MAAAAAAEADARARDDAASWRLLAERLRKLAVEIAAHEETFGPFTLTGIPSIRVH